jgi:adenylate cyclase
MAREIERKFLVVNDDWRAQVSSTARYRQGYLSGSGKCSVRVRVDGDRGYLNLKSATLDIDRTEYEYEIPLSDAEEMLAQLCEGLLVEKQRYFVEHSGHTWEIDVFEGDNEGLVIAEIELDDVDSVFTLPSWAGTEVSDDPRYYNVYLARTPFRQW